MRKFMINNTILIWAVICLLVMILSSCNRYGYGCHGKSKCITRVAKCKPKDYMKKANAYKIPGDKAIYYRHGDHCHRYFSTGWAGTS